MNYELGIKITGRVLHGDRYGKVLGFPTANLDRRGYSRRRMKIKLGIYAGWAEIGKGSKIKDKRYRSAIVIGPIDKTGLPKIEAHLINFKGNLYGKYLSIYFGIYLRPFKKFKNVEELKRQIEADIQRVKRLK